MTTDNLIDVDANEVPLRARPSAWPSMLARAICGCWMRWSLSRLIDRVGYFRWRRAVEAELSGLDERTLHDIGISRSDIPSIASQTYFRDETRRKRNVRIHAASEAQKSTSSTVSFRARRCAGWRGLRDDALSRPWRALGRGSHVQN